MRELVESVVERTGLPRASADAAVRAAFAAIVDGMARGHAVRVWGFGTFEVVTVRGRAGWDFARGELMRGLVSRRVRFKAGSAVQRALRGEE